MDTYSPIVVTTESEYAGVTEVFPCQAKSPVTKQSYPVTFPFSAMVPQVYSQVSGSPDSGHMQVTWPQFLFNSCRSLFVSAPAMQISWI